MPPALICIYIHKFGHNIAMLTMCLVDDDVVAELLDPRLSPGFEYWTWIHGSCIQDPCILDPGSRILDPGSLMCEWCLFVCWVSKSSRCCGLWLTTYSPDGLITLFVSLLVQAKNSACRKRSLAGSYSQAMTRFSKWILICIRTGAFVRITGCICCRVDAD